MSIENSIETSINKLLVVMKQLRDPKTGCEWDKKQDFKSISPFTIEEAYEVVDAIEREDYESLLDELGDLLLQVVFHSEIASELGLFEFEDVTNSIRQKLINRHPYVFKDPKKHTEEQQLTNWEEVKFKEKETKNIESIMDDLPHSLPALLRSQKIQKRAAQVGFDWNSEEGYFGKIEEEITELQEAIKISDREAIKDEIGDLLLSVVNLARYLKLDAEDSLRKSNKKFEKRFRFIESELKKQKKKPSNASLKEMDQLWNKAKKEL